ncbi:glycoside hydrolase family 95 protein [Glonium stellatum]|uniref:Glycoside hydrolase family 95 protein n=1 Tax=Glonium stellatum TaxID=574774 RepID=A0A8E2JPE4_9PEZI|nr:glycoside hydrolase family 95 protein [Glonium stellatum]
MPFFLYLAVLVATLVHVDAKSLWSSTAAEYSDVIREAYLVGNGRLGAMPFGGAGAEKVNLNVDSLWSGGPFESDNYTGGNPSTEKHAYLPGIREWIFQNGTGNLSQLLGSNSNYGSYQVLGNLTVSFDVTANAATYNRSLDLTTGVHITSFDDDNGNTYTSTVYCSYPDQVCVYQLSSSAALPDISVSLENQLVNSTVQNQSCGNGYVRLTGVTQVGPPLGMKYDAIARVVGGSHSSYCSNITIGSLIIPGVHGVRSIGFVIGAGTNYDRTKGDAANGFSFKGDDPGSYVEKVTSTAATKSATDLSSAHVKDYQSLSGAFSLELPDPNGSAGVEISTLIDQYTSNGTGDPFLESLLFDYSRHLFISSSRDNSLPPNLQGRWNYQLSSAWSADYHANINLQMNHWVADQTGLGDLQVPLWRYMQDTWVPRGTETARLLYGAPGWVTHDEMNIFGHTGMKDTAQWANYPVSAAWMMQHVSDHFAYSQNLTWLRTQGYPLIKGVAAFWLSQLQPDAHTHDGTLVVNPCNSPEHGPTTFACAHYQQLLHQLFATVLSLGPLVSDSAAFLANVSATLPQLDKGLHISPWGGVQEWKLPATQGYDVPNDTHRHLSSLWGWYPGRSLASPSAPFLGGFANATVQRAVATELWSRGPGDGPDANAGWEKVWRAACWARLNETERAYFELRFTVEQNFAGNGLSMYSGKNPPFQIDANFGLGGAMLAMLVVDIEEGMGGTRTVVLGPAIPSSWGGGRVSGLRVRGGGKVDFGWDQMGVVTWATAEGKGVRFVNKQGKVVEGG